MTFWVTDFERNLPYLANIRTQILRQLDKSFPQEKKAIEINGHLLSVPEIG